MRRLATLGSIALAACAAGRPRVSEPLPASVGRAIGVAWKVAQGEGHLVLVTIVIDGRSVELGTLDASSESAPGTPRTCALRAAHPLRTELTCGELTSYFAAELDHGELVLSLVDPAGRRELRRVPAMGEGLAVQPYALPE